MRADDPSTTRAEWWALIYLALPNVLFVGGWIVGPLGPIAAVAVAITVLLLLRRGPQRIPPGLGPLIVPVVAIATLWCLTAGIGHFVYANRDWVVRDAVLRDLTLEPWPVTYLVDGAATVLRAPIAYFLPASLVGARLGPRAAEIALLVWTAWGVALVFAMMLRDRPPLAAALIRIVIFVAFSGMDIVGEITHYKPYALGDHLEWWAFLFQYSSQTTQLFWVPNHALPGWIAVAWLLGQDPKRLSIPIAVLFVAFAPLWSPLTALGIAPLMGVAIVRRLAGDRIGHASRALLDWRMLLPAAVCVALVFPYLVAGSDQVASGNTMDVRWVGEDFVPRYIEFVLFEFVGFALLLLMRDARDPLLWTAIAVLLALPFYHFGPFNDLAMRASIPALTLLAMRLGAWLSTPTALTRDPRARLVAVVLVAIGAATPAMEFARIFLESPWDFDTRSSVIDVTRGTHYLTATDRPWMARFLKRPQSR